MCRVTLVALSALLPLLGSGCDERPPSAWGAPATAPARASTPAEPVRIVPWVEYNGSKKLIPRFAAGLRSWRVVTDTAIVSINGAESITDLREMQRLAPGMRIVPGLKTYLHMPDRFDALSGWEQVAQHAARIVEATGERVLLLENETALKKVYNGEQQVDPAVLRACLRLLPQNVLYLWYPCSSSGLPQWERYLPVNRIVEDVLDVHFIDAAGLFGPAEIDEKARRKVKDALLELADRPVIPIIYSFGSDRGKYNRVWWWTEERVPEALRLVRERYDPGTWAIVYPGSTYWDQAAERLSHILPPLSPNAPPLDLAPRAPASPSEPAAPGTVPPSTPASAPRTVRPPRAPRANGPRRRAR